MLMLQGLTLHFDSLPTSRWSKPYSSPLSTVRNTYTVVRETYTVFKGFVRTTPGTSKAMIEARLRGVFPVGYEPAFEVHEETRDIPRFYASAPSSFLQRRSSTEDELRYLMRRDPDQVIELIRMLAERA